MAGLYYDVQIEVRRVQGQLTPDTYRQLQAVRKRVRTDLRKILIDARRFARQSAPARRGKQRLKRKMQVKMRGKKNLVGGVVFTPVFYGAPTNALNRTAGWWDNALGGYKDDLQSLAAETNRDLARIERRAIMVQQENEERKRARQNRGSGRQNEQSRHGRRGKGMDAGTDKQIRRTVNRGFAGGGFSVAGIAIAVVAGLVSVVVSLGTENQ